jgi:hypothetical protein
METVKQMVANAILGLPDTANFSDIQAVLETLQQEFETVAENEPMAGMSAYDLAKDLLGCIDGPPDLSTNKAYFEGFGL